jgi:hypothetical protein
MLIPWLYFLQEDEQLLLEGFTRRWVVNGPGRVTVPPLHKVTRRKGLLLGPTDYVRIRDTISGQLRNERGPKLYFLQAAEAVVETLTAIPLKHNEYVRLIDHQTGAMRVERGEQSVYLAPTEAILEDVREGVNIDEQTAILIRDTGSGQLDLVTAAQVFVPAATEEIAEIRKRIQLEDHITVIIKTKAGEYLFKRGSDSERAFFLEPYQELVQFYWSAGLHKDSRSLRITHIDLRPKFMWYEFEVRTQDNVELVIGITFFWQIVDVEAMVHTTDDAPGDVCSHARSTIIQSVSQVTLERFLAEFNPVVSQAILNADDPFYGERGVKLHAVEVRAITCKDPGTQRILQEIIQETTNRLNRLQKQESENEIELKRVRGQIEAEGAKGELLTLQRDHVRTEALMRGEAEADRVHAFLTGLGEDMALTDKIALFNTLRKQEALKNLSQGTAQLYFTPDDVNLSIET